ncbi:YhbP family protein [Sodalis sp. dw_96]|uniref:YhbP family protein n=1 Tax=Sodalis sp. dw_96 TaxID=2719794 RepID=UPI001BD4D83C
MKTESDLKSIVNYLKKQHVLSVCVGDAESLWCANCFYALNEAEMTLYMLTDHGTRHGTLLAQYHRVAGTISDQTITVSLIKGAQYSGEMTVLSGTQADTARKLYTSRFPLAKIATTPIWQLRLDEIKLTNNKLGFGTKLSWTRDADNKSDLNI